MEIWATHNAAAVYDLKERLLKGVETYGHQVMGWDDDDDDELPNPVVYRIESGVAIAKIKGAMIANTSWLSRIYGIVSYQDIQEVLAKLVRNQDVQTIVLDYDTPGGSFAGIAECGRAIQAVDKVKPVYSYVSGSAHSGGAWLSTAARAVYGVPESSSYGSIGVIVVHTEVSRLRQEIGYNDTVFRSAPKKALGTPYEPLSDEARAEINSDISYIHDLFVSALSSHLSKPFSDIAKIATGATFWAPRALELGLVSKLLPIEELVGTLAANR